MTHAIDEGGAPRADTLYGRGDAPARAPRSSPGRLAPVRLGACALIGALAVACGGESGDEAAEGSDAPGGSAPAGQAGAAGGAADTPTRAEGAAAAGDAEGAGEESTFAAPTAPPRGCRFGEPAVVWRRPGWVDVEGSTQGFFVAGSASHGAYEMAFLALLRSGGEPHVLAQSRLEAPVPEGRRRAAPALAIEGARGALALVDGESRLLLSRFEPSAASALPFAMVAENASLSFRPALLRGEGGWYIAWTEERGEAGRRVRGAWVPDRGDMAEPADLTPDAGGGAAPSFVDGAEPPALVFVDARQGTSVAHRVPLTADGFGETEVARPIGLLPNPPEAAAVHLGERAFLLYTGIGSAATSAVGLVALTGTDAPTSVLPGEGYGALHVDVAPLGDGAVIAVDAPRERPPESPREIQVRRLTAGAQGESGAPAPTLGPPAVVRGPSQSTARARVAARDDVIAVTFGSDEGVHVVIGRCAAPEPS